MGTGLSRGVLARALRSSGAATSLAVGLVGCLLAGEAPSDRKVEPGTGSEALTLATCECARPQLAASNSSSCEECAFTLDLKLPRGGQIAAVALAASRELTIGERSALLNGSSNPTITASLGECEGTFVGSRTRVESDIYSQSSVYLASRSEVAGDVTSSADVHKSRRAVVSGATFSNRSFTPLETLSYGTTFPRTTPQPLTIERSAILAPGAYGRTVVRPRASLKLTGGTYKFESLEIEDRATLTTEPNSGATYIDVRTKFRSRGVWPGDASKVLVSVYSGMPVEISSGFAGSLVAPQSDVTLFGDLSRPYSERGTWKHLAHRFERAYAGDPTSGRVDSEDATDTDSADGRSIPRAADISGAFFGNSISISRRTIVSTIPFQEWAHVSSHDAQLTIPPPAVPPPSLRPLHQPPPLNASGTGVRPQVAEFTQWAARSLKEEEEDIRLALLQVRGRPEFIEAFEAEVTEARASDWTHAFLALSLLGSIRDATTEPYLIALAREAGPTSGTFLSDGALPDNVPLEATYLAMLQSVAVDALVLLDSQTAKAEIRRIAREHESRLVRAEAIRAYVLRFEAAGRAELEREIRADDMWHLDRFENVNIDGGPSFDTRLSGYISSHPEVMTYESEAQ